MGFDFGSFAGGLASAGVGIYSANQEYDIAKKNYKLQKKQFAYQKDLQQQLFQREDTAQQRAAADLEAAGLSKTLAAGSGASAGPVVSTQAPQMDSGFARTQRESMTQAIGLALQIARERADISKTQADTAVSQATAQNLDKQNTLFDDTYNFKVLREQVGLNTDQAKYASLILDNRIKHFQISQQDIERIKAQLAVDAAQMGLTDAELSIAAKRIAIQQAIYNQDWYKTRGLPSDAGVDRDIQKTSYLGKALQDILEKMKR